MTTLQNTTPNLSIGAENLKRLCWLCGTLIAVEGVVFFLASRHFNIQITGLVLACLITLLMIDIHLLGMWLTFVLRAFLINYFVELMASALRRDGKQDSLPGKLLSSLHMNSNRWG
ncbi:hypothetical protein [Salinisphaera sp. G21_0]|uniref:hypothetical protein n=1 Tax=Salinisphaera sp. G21_0 TaxID=2821094 RepID=UPI001ADA0448|nr:hypothetical protein [Salinisphaera sp. G21_0]MBO9483900.1 hypothetical protein [Salinisphaera sp. G21_0]